VRVSAGSTLTKRLKTVSKSKRGVPTFLSLGRLLSLHDCASHKRKLKLITSSHADAEPQAASRKPQGFIYHILRSLFLATNKVFARWWTWTWGSRATDKTLKTG
jgi:hypothetical protein